MAAPRNQNRAKKSLGIQDLIRRYQQSGRPVTVNFRQIGLDYGFPDDTTHLIHPYPAKLLPHIPRWFLSTDALCSPGDVVLDPFCGSGTVLLEAILAGRRAIGADANPLARLISRVKVRSIGHSVLRRTADQLMSRLEQPPKAASIPEVVNLDYWFYPHVVRQLAAIRKEVQAIKQEPLREFFQVCFSVCVRRVSRSDLRLTVPVRLTEHQYSDGHPLRVATERRLRRLRRLNVRTEFFKIVEANIIRQSRLPDTAHSKDIAVYDDARKLQGPADAVRDSSVALIVTSPPYLGAQKYVRASSLSLGWLGLCEPRGLAQLESVSIGREHFRKHEITEALLSGVAAADRRIRAVRGANPLRAHLAAVYLREMRSVIDEMWRVLRPGGHIVFVCGDNSLAGAPFRTSKYLLDIMTSKGFVTRLRLVDTILSRGMMTKRNKTAGLITREWVFLVQKP